MRKTLLATSMLAALAAPALVRAEEPAGKPEEKQPSASASSHALTGNVSFASQYVFRGIAQTNGKPAIQGGLDYSHASGLYLGAWSSNISWYTDQNAGTVSAPVPLSSPGSVGAPYAPNKSNSAAFELDVYGGIRNSFAGDWNYDVGLIAYRYPGTFDNVGAYRRPDTTELYGAIGYKWITLKYSGVISAYTFGTNESRGATYLDVSANVPLGKSGYTFVAHVGSADYPGKANFGYWGTSGGNNNDYDYTDFKLGLTKEFSGFTCAFSWTHANTKRTGPDGQTTAYNDAFGRNIGGRRIALVVTKNF
jgi:uncharacterized protein (TIGR02001 family)